MKTIMHSPQTLPLNACAVRARWLAPIRKFFLILATLGAGGAGQAADVVWDGGLTATGTTWLAAENWAGDLVPGDNDNAIFDSVGTVTILGIDMNTALSTQRVDSITLGPGRAASNLTIRNSSTTTNGFLQLNGSSGTLLSNATSLTLSINNGTSQPMGLGLAASGDIFVSGTQQGVGGIISISSSISDVGGPRSINKVGGGTLYLRGVNSFSGNLTNVEGSLQVDATGTFGAGSLYLNGGDIVCAADRSGGAPLTNPVVMSANCFVINNAGTVGTSRTIPFSGPWSGNCRHSHRRQQHRRPEQYVPDCG
jgi:autotransporter-associated beta strand protein